MRGLLITCGLAALCYFTGVHTSVIAFLGIGSAQYGISKDDPLGTAERIHHVLTNAGFEGDFGTVNKPRTIAYTNPYDEKLYPGFASVLVITVGDEEYIQKIAGAFVGSQHGYSPQKATMVEQQLISMWRSVGGPRTSFKAVEDEPLRFPTTVKFGKGFSLPQNHKESKFETPDVKGLWAYGESSPQEVIQLELR
jgi:hypothetical protein